MILGSGVTTGYRTLLGARGIATRSKDATRVQVPEAEPFTLGAKIMARTSAERSSETTLNKELRLSSIFFVCLLYSSKEISLHLAVVSLHVVVEMGWLT